MVSGAAQASPVSPFRAEALRPPPESGRVHVVEGKCESKSRMRFTPPKRGEICCWMGVRNCFDEILTELDSGD